ncbi:MAG: galactose mutarotase [Acidobacteria bacterium]|nr:galactose mutarotase [Acidobacteriota bacterium]
MVRSLVLCFALFPLLSAAGCAPDKEEEGSVTTNTFGRLADGRAVKSYLLENPSGVLVEVLDYGAVIRRIVAPDREGKMADVVLGYDTVEGYERGGGYLGAVVGRYGNRIAGGRFPLDGGIVELAVNDGPNHLHGGRRGFDRALWEGAVVEDPAGPSVSLRLVSPDGEEGYPGTVRLKVTYTLTDKNELRIEYEGTTDKPTVLNPTQHSYFNLSGDFTRTILGHRLSLEADAITEVGPGLIPTGRLLDVAGTPFDFRSSTEIGARIGEPDGQLAVGGGYDHNWVLRGERGEVRRAAELYEPGSGRVMTVSTDQPGIQFYSGNFLDGSQTGKGGVAHGARSGLCLETQAFPDTPNRPQFPQATLRPGETYRQVTLYQFSTR